MSLIASLFDITKKDLKRARPVVERINALEPQIQRLTEAEMQAKTDEFRSRLAAEESLDQLLPEAFALVREASVRAIGLRHFDVQMIGGIVLHEGKIAEMKTGEGKTLVATLPIYLNALTGRGVHLATHNDYLAKRDARWMGPIYRLLGMTVGVIQASTMTEHQPSYLYAPGESAGEGLENFRVITRREAYHCDIVYATHQELGFDYLRDNLAFQQEDLTQRELHYAIVDEVDSLLIDEARTPLIISGPARRSTTAYQRVDKIVRRLQRETDFIVDEKSKTATLTDQGVRRVEEMLGVENLSDPENLELMQHTLASLRAHAAYHKDVDYVVTNGQVIIIDEFTGRPMYGRRYSEGLHQAIEAKEGVKIERETQTVATITYQNFFRLYQKLAGMTGTAKTEEQEFIKIYGLPVVLVPTHRPMIRKDDPDVVYKTEEAKFRGIIGEILQLESRGQPVLVGTRSIQVSELVSERLKPEKLQLFARLQLMHDRILEGGELDDRQRKELRVVLEDRLNETNRQQRHLEAALEQFELRPTQISQPEEVRRLELRLRRLAGLAEDLQAALAKLNEGQGLGGGEMRRLADIIAYQRLEEVKPARLPSLMQVFGLPPDPAHSDNLRLLAKVIGLDGQMGRLAELLETGIPHQVLNAKYHEQEAQIIAQAGRSGTVTIATNMAGRGVDILLGGSVERMALDLLAEQGVDPDQAATEQLEQARAEARRLCEEDRQRVLAQGGLHILGTERHESRRIDNQLRGRAGRQGDPGSSRFYVSLEDEVMRLFGPERFDFFFGKWEECEPLIHRILSGTIENAQRKVEAHNFSIRQHVLQYDDVMNLQREVIYGQRRRVLEGADLKDSVLASLEKVVQDQLHELASKDLHPEDWNLQALYQSLYEFFPIHYYLRPEDLEGKSRDELEELLLATIRSAYEDREAQLGPETMRDLERMVTLRVIDTRWIDHLDAMDLLEEGISLRGYGGMDPLIAYKKEAFLYWQQLLSGIQEEIVKLMFRVQLVQEERVREQQPDLHQIAVSAGGGDGPAQPYRSSKKVGRNDPCPCGSGKKYKKCCMVKAG